MLARNNRRPGEFENYARIIGLGFAVYIIIVCTCRALSEQKCTCVKKMEYSDSEIESDCALSTMTLGLETDSGQTSNTESTIPESSSHASASTASSLLALLHPTRPSDLSQKRQE